jgi:hypothetical protein
MRMINKGDRSGRDELIGISVNPQNSFLCLLVETTFSQRPYGHPPPTLPL